MQRAGGEVVHAAASEALPEVTHSLNSLVRIVLGLLKLGNRLADLARLEVKLAEIEANLQIVRVLLHPLPASLQFVSFAFGFDARRLFDKVGRVWVDLGEGMFKFPHCRIGNSPLERRVGVALGGRDALVIFQRLVELIPLGAKLGGRAEESKIARLLRDARFAFGEQARGHVLRLDGAFLLFQRNRLLLVFQNVAVGTGAALERLVAAFAQGSLGGNILQYLRDFRVVGKGAGELTQDSFSLVAHPGARERPAEFQGDLAVGRNFEGDFQR